MEVNNYEKECPICNEPINYFHNAECNHNFCYTCIIKLINERKEIHCPLCRQSIIQDVNKWEEENTEELYQHLKLILKTEESQTLHVTSDLITMVKFMLESKKQALLKFLLYETIQYEFKVLYDECIVKDKKYFKLINDPYESFALAWLFYKYH